MAVKKSEEHQNELTVLCVEAQGSSDEDVLRLALEKSWLGKGVLWTSERPCDSPGRGLPAFVLLDSEGRQLLGGNPLAMKSDIEAALDEEFKKLKKGPDDVPKDLRDAYRDAGRGKWSSAITAAEKLSEEAGDDAQLAEAAAAAAEQWRKRATARVERIGRLVDAGYYTRAGEMLEELDGELEAVPDAQQKASELRAQLESDELENEVEAEKALCKMEDKLFSEGTRKFKGRHLEKLAEKYPSTKASERAKRYLPYLER